MYKNFTQLVNEFLALENNNVIQLQQNIRNSIFHYKQGLLFIDMDNYKKAIEKFDLAIKEDDTNALFYYSKGLLFSKIGDKQQALEHYNKSIVLNPNIIEVYYNKGVILYGLGKVQEAIDVYNKATDFNPQFAEAYYNKGIALEDIGNYQAAIESYNQALYISPGAKAYYNKAMSLNGLGQYNQAIESVNQAISYNPSFIDDCYYNRALYYSKLTDYILAIDSYKKTIEVNPNYSKAYHGLAEMHYYLNDYKESIKGYQALLQKFPDDEAAKGNMQFMISKLPTKEQTEYNTNITQKEQNGSEYDQSPSNKKKLSTIQLDEEYEKQSDSVEEKDKIIEIDKHISDQLQPKQIQQMEESSKLQEEQYLSNGIQFHAYSYSQPLPSTEYEEQHQSSHYFYSQGIGKMEEETEINNKVNLSGNSNNNYDDV